jgi:hypothetical protein
MKLRTKSAIVLLAAAAAVSSPAMSGEYRHHHHLRFQSWQVGGGGNGLPSYIPGIGTYAGGIAATYIRGNGLYIAVDPGILPAGTSSPMLAPKAKIIDVPEVSDNSACSMERGVCVIRADR